jgi:hypothetical protein
MTTWRTLALAAIAVMLAASPIRAHHDWPVDRSRPITIHGTVTAFTWANPHVTIALDVESDGAIEKWILGASSPKVLLDHGWDKTTLKPGDVVSATGFRFRNGSNVAQLQRIVTPSGRELYYAGPKSAGIPWCAPHFAEAN